MVSSFSAIASRRFGEASLIVSLLRLVAAHTRWNGYRFGDSNLSIHVPLIKQYSDPTLYPGDPLLETRPRFTSFFFPAMGLYLRIFGADALEAAYFFAFVASELLTLFAFWRISLLLFDDRPSGVVLMLLVLAPTPALAGDVFNTSRFTHSLLSSALLFFALYLYLAGRVLPAYVLTGAVFNVHSLNAAFVFCMMALDSLLDARRQGVRRLFAPWGAFLLLSFPTALWTLRVREPLNAVWVDVLRRRSGHHSFPLEWEPKVYVAYLLLFAIAAFAVPSVRRELHRKVLRFFAAVVILSVAGVVFTEWIPLKAALQGQLFRSTHFLTGFALVYTARSLVGFWSHGKLARAASGVVFLGLFLPHLYVGLLPVALLLILFSRARQLPRPAVLFSCGVLVLYGIFPPAQIPEQLGMPGLAMTLRDIVSEESMLLFAALFVVIRLGAASRWGRAVAACVTALVLIVYALPNHYASVRHRLRRSDWVDVQLWCRENTPKNATFLTPPDLAGFRVFSERPVVGEWKDGTQQYFSDRFAEEWWRRMQDVGGVDASFRQQREGRLLETARRYGAQYLVFPMMRPRRFPLLYANDEFAVYSLAEGVTNATPGN